MKLICPDVIIHHGPCFDGLLSMFLVRKYWRNENFELDEPDYEPTVIHIKPDTKLTNTVREQCRGKLVLMLDVLYKPDDMKELMEMSTVYAIDHHRSNIVSVGHLFKTNDDMYSNDVHVNAILDESTAACELTYRWLYCNERIPSFVKFTAMRDMFVFDDQYVKPYSNGFFDIVAKLKTHTALELYEEMWQESVDSFDRVNNVYGLPMLDKIVKHGEELDKRNDIINEHFLSLATKYTIKGRDGTVYTVYAVPTRENRSEIANKLSERIEAEYANDEEMRTRVFGVTYHYSIEHNEWWVSLRATKKSPVDLSVIAPNILETAGGHPGAAGITWTRPLNELLHPITK